METNLKIWNEIINILYTDRPNWESEINALGQVQKIEQRNQGVKYSDNEIYEGFVHAIFTASIDYRRVKENYHRIKKAFYNFDLSIMSHKELYSSKEEIYNELGFNGRYDSNKPEYTQNNLANKAIKSASEINRIIAKFGTMELFFERYCMNDPMTIVQYLIRGEYKISGMMDAIAHEALKNIGFDTIKPDQHITRIFYFMGWYTKNNGWKTEKDQINYRYPILNRCHVKELMTVANNLKKELNINSLGFLDNVLWFLCSKTGLHYTNNQLERIVLGLK